MYATITGSEDRALRGAFRFLVAFARNLVIELEESVLLSIIGVNDIGNLHELVVIHVEQVVLDSSLVDDI